ncbi:hypothetical protein M404DRAFT_376398 [Pisolithus tinctorius Marx 270]|uniref:Uncharacterized protein n=1 Tax=Pisolithus tinctorius Marx 270 TaxID=870435 RepID=A0A0C3PII8_PISTI|nr:hypothetical protein M404DRAFT_376398 [Pisolithus tinctorius Marx 270]
MGCSMLDQLHNSVTFTNVAPVGCRCTPGALTGTLHPFPSPVCSAKQSGFNSWNPIPLDPTLLCHHHIRKVTLGGRAPWSPDVVSDGLPKTHLCSRRALLGVPI